MIKFTKYSELIKLPFLKLLLYFQILKIQLNFSTFPYLPKLIKLAKYPIFDKTFEKVGDELSIFLNCAIGKISKNLIILRLF